MTNNSGLKITYHPNPHPNAIGGTGELWYQVWAGWLASQAGDIETAKRYFFAADALCPDGRLNPSLSVLRHNIGEGKGSVKPVEATEDSVVTLGLPYIYSGSKTEESLRPLGDIPEAHLEKVVAGLEAGHHKDNIKHPRPHVMVLSTGRCGTMSLYRLFQDSNLEPYHTYWFMVSRFSRWEMCCRLFADSHDNFDAAAEWASTRAAEWLGEKPMIGLNHADTAYAPVFAAIHPESRFIYLRREPEDVFKSFVRKSQWCNGSNHFRPVLYDFGEDYSSSLPEVSEAEGTRWHINYTEKFCRSFGNVMGDRFIEVSSDKLFAQDENEIGRLLEFTGSDIRLEYAVEHFKTKINEKKHKEVVPTTPEAMKALQTL